KQRNIEIPFFFSGDGCAVIAPGDMSGEILIAFLLHNDNCLKTLGLNMHIGSISVAEIKSQGGSISLSKMEVGVRLHKAIVLGNGLRLAERMIKNSSREKDAAEQDLTGV